MTGRELARRLGVGAWVVSAVELGRQPCRAELAEAYRSALQSTLPTG